MERGRLACGRRETGGGWSRWRKCHVAIADRGFVVRRVEWRQMSEKRHTEATPPSHVPGELLAMRRGMSRVLDCAGIGGR